MMLEVSHAWWWPPNDEEAEPELTKSGVNPFFWVNPSGQGYACFAWHKNLGPDAVDTRRFLSN
jgi:hypothetical protein